MAAGKTQGLSLAEAAIRPDCGAAFGQLQRTMLRATVVAVAFIFRAETK